MRVGVAERREGGVDALEADLAGDQRAWIELGQRQLEVCLDALPAYLRESVAS